MNVQNFRLFQIFTKKEKQLDSIEKKQTNLLSLLKREYEHLRQLQKPRKATTREKLMRFRNLRTTYTFKLPKNEHGNSSGSVNSNADKFKNGWLQTSTHQNLTPHVHELSERRHKMIVSGNTWSKNNNKAAYIVQRPSFSAIRKVASAPSTIIKRETFERRMEFGKFQEHKQAAKRPEVPSNPAKVDESSRQRNQLTAKQSNAGNVYHTMPKMKLSGEGGLCKDKKEEEEASAQTKEVNGNCQLGDKSRTNGMLLCDEICHGSVDERISVDLINEISEPSIFQMEVSSDEGKIYRSAEVIGIENILEAVEEVKRKVSEVIQEEVIDYGAINDVIMIENKIDDDYAEVKKASCEKIESQHEQQQQQQQNGKMDDENYSQMMMEDVTCDSATVSNASMKCLKSLMSINCRSLALQNEEKNARTLESCSSTVNPECFLASERCTSTSTLSKSLSSLDDETAAFDADVSNQAIETLENLPESCEESTNSSTSTLMKLCAALEGISNGLIGAVLSRHSATIEQNLCEYQHSSDDANSKNADNGALSSSKNDEECKLKLSACSVAATFTSKKQISERILEVQREKMNVEEKWNVGAVASKISSGSSRPSESSEILSNVENFDD